MASNSKTARASRSILIGVRWTLHHKARPPSFCERSRDAPTTRARFRWCLGRLGMLSTRITSTWTKRGTVWTDLSCERSKRSRCPKVLWRTRACFRVCPRKLRRMTTILTRPTPRSLVLWFAVPLLFGGFVACSQDSGSNPTKNGGATSSGGSSGTSGSST